MLASVPESEAIMSLRRRRSRANQLAAEPESEVRIARSGRRRESSKNTSCGLIGSAGAIARFSITRHHSPTLRSIDSRQLRSCLRSRCPSRARRVGALSPTRLTSIG